MHNFYAHVVSNIKKYKETHVCILGSYCVPNEECVFPFTYYGIEHNSCTTADSSNGYWCSTDAEYSGGYVYCACKSVKDAIKMSQH